MGNSPEIKINKELLPDGINDIDIEIKNLDEKINGKNKNLFSYKSYEYTDVKTDKTKVDYRACFMGETLEIGLDSPEQLIRMLKLIDKILTIYKKEGYKDKFYPKGWTVGTDKNDLSIDNRPFEFFDTDFLSQEGFGKLLNEEDNEIINIHIYELADFLNKVIEKM